MKTKRQKTKQQIISTIVVFFMFIMVSGTVNVMNGNAATTVYMNLIQNFVSGVMSIECMENLAFNDITIGSPTSSLANMTSFNIRDYRGSGAGWNVTAFSNDLTISNSADGINNVSNASIAMNPSTATILGLDGSSTTGVSLGAAAYLNYARTMVISTVGNGSGNYAVNNITFNVVYNGRADQLAGVYQAQVTFQIN